MAAGLGAGAGIERSINLIVLDKCHNTRNLGEYEGMLDIDERLVKDLITATDAVAAALRAAMRGSAP